MLLKRKKEETKSSNAILDSICVTVVKQADYSKYTKGQLADLMKHADLACLNKAERIMLTSFIQKYESSPRATKKEELLAVMQAVPESAFVTSLSPAQKEEEAIDIAPSNSYSVDVPTSLFDSLLETTEKAVKVAISNKKEATAPAVAKKEKPAKPVAVKKTATKKELFPAEINLPGIGNLVSMHDSLANYNDIRSFMSLNPDIELYFLTSWSPAQIKKHDYAVHYKVSAPQKFPLNYDVLVPVVVPTKVERIYTMSVYTDAVNRFEPASLSVLADKPYRIDNGMEFEIYVEKDQSVFIQN